MASFEEQITERIAGINSRVKSGELEFQPESSWGLGNRANEVGGFLSMLGNLAAAGGETLSDIFAPSSALAAAHSSPAKEATAQAGEGLGRLALGGMELYANPASISPNAQLTRNVAADEASYFPGGENFDTDKTRFLSTLAGLLPAGPKGTMAGRVLRAGQSLDPVVGAGRLVGAAGRGATKLIPGANRLIAEALGVTTGAGGARAQAMIDAGKAGERDVALRGIREQDTPYELGEDVIRAENRRLGSLTERKNTVLNREGEVDISGLKRDLLGDIENEGAGGILSDMGIRVRYDPAGGDILVNEGSTSRRISLDLPPGFRANLDTAPIDRAVRELLESADVIPAMELDKIKSSISGIPVPKGARRLGEGLQAIRSSVRDRLGDIPEFDRASDRIRDFFRQTDTEGRATGGVEVSAEKLGVPSLIDEASTGTFANRQRTGNAMTRAFNKSDDQPNKMQALEDIESVSPGARTRAAAQGFSGYTPNEIIGRNQFFQSLTALGAVLGAGAATGGLGALASLPAVAVAFVPRYAGQSLLRLGQMEANAEKFSALARKMVEQAGTLGINARGLTLGELADRLESSTQSSIMSQVGNAANR